MPEATNAPRRGLRSITLSPQGDVKKHQLITKVNPQG